jgi:hypothetical protein
MFGPARRPRSSPPALVSALGSAILLALTLPDCGGSSRVTTPPQPSATPPPVTLPPTPTTLADLSATVTSPQENASINCSDDVTARVTLVNRGGTTVTIKGVLDRSGIPAGRCRGESDFTYQSRASVALPGSTTVVLNGSLYSDGPGCCDGRGCAGSCVFQEAFEVITDLGNVPAGAFNYTVFFQNCRSCATSAAAAGNAACASARR